MKSEADYSSNTVVYVNFLGDRTDDISDLKSGDDGGTFDSMEARVARLESDVEHIKKSVDRIERGQDDVRKIVGEMKVDFGRFDERLKTMPGKGFIFSVATGIVAAAGTLIALAVRFIPAAG